LAQLKMLTRMSKYLEREPKAGQQVFIDVPLRIELLYPYRGHQTRLSRGHQMQHTTFDARMAATCPCAFKVQQSILLPTDAFDVTWSRRLTTTRCYVERVTAGESRT
jgi:hypothetical protein